MACNTRIWVVLYVRTYVHFRVQSKVTAVESYLMRRTTYTNNLYSASASVTNGLPFTYMSHIRVSSFTCMNRSIRTCIRTNGPLLWRMVCHLRIWDVLYVRTYVHTDHYCDEWSLVSWRANLIRRLVQLKNTWKQWKSINEWVNCISKDHSV